MLDRIVTGDCLKVLPTIQPGSVDLVVTSPPYPGLRGHTLGVTAWLRWFTERLELIARVLAPTGVIALNVDFPRRDGWRDARLYTQLLPLFEDCYDLFLVDVYIWHKPNPVPAGNLDRHDIPSWEPIFILARSANYAFYPVRTAYSQKTVEKAAAGNMRSNGVGHDYATGGHDELHPDGARQGNVLCISSSGDQGRPRAKGGSFPLALPARFIEQHSKPGDLVLDPFCGAGTTCYAAKQLGRHYLGVEIDEEEARKARVWLTEPIQRPLLDPAGAPPSYGKTGTGRPDYQARLPLSPKGTL